MVNKARGETELKVDGRTYILRPSFETLSAVEDATQKGTMDLLAAIRRGRPRMKDIVVTLWVAAKANKDNRDVPEIEEFGELIRRGQGLIPAGKVMLEFLGSSVATDKQLREAEEEADEEKTKDPDPSKPSEEPTDSEPNPSS